MDWLLKSAAFCWAVIGYILGVGTVLFLTHYAPVTDAEKRALIRRWQDELDAAARDK